MRDLLCIFCALIFAACNGNAKQASGDKAASFSRVFIDRRDSTEIYVNDGDSDRLFYYAQAPDAAIQGALVLFPPNGESVEAGIDANGALLAKARNNGLVVLIPSINHNVCLDATTLAVLNSMIGDAIGRYGIPETRFVFGGFSLGGMNAIRYTELSFEDRTATRIRPAAVFGIDPPLDLARLYHSFQRAVQKNFSQPAVQEARYFLQRLEQEFGGSPEVQRAAYVQHSMYSHHAPDGGNTKFLRTIPVRIYSDPDIDWQLKNRRVDFYDMNALDGSAMINQLHMMGNERAEFVNALGKGIRPNGDRHPHSWSLADPEECIAWILKCIQ